MFRRFSSEQPLASQRKGGVGSFLGGMILGGFLGFVLGAIVVSCAYRGMENECLWCEDEEECEETCKAEEHGEKEE